jgi:hypothetical protein
MKRVFLLASAGALAFLTGGCSYFSFLPWVDDPNEITGVVEEAPIPSPAASPEPGFEDPVEPGGQPSVVGLVQPTNPKERSRQVQKGREDPFAVIPVEPVITREEIEPAIPPVASLPQPGRAETPTPPQRGKVAGNENGAGSKPTATAPSQPGTTTFPRGTQPSGVPERSIPRLEPGQLMPGEEGLRFPPGLPPQPQPAIASAIAVSGVVQVGTAPKAIIKAPNEEYSRYVQPGEYVSNGQVLVKRIEVGRGLYPTVIFEENGIEFSRQVGAGGQIPEAGTENPTAFVSTSSGKV